MNKLSKQLRLKLCGMTRPQDAALASELGADAIGLIFYPNSARNVGLAQAREIIAEINPLCLTVAVVVNPDETALDQLLDQLNINVIQFHGDESPEFCAQFSTPYIKAIRITPKVCLSDMGKRYKSARALLLDTYDKNRVGGTGKIFDWSLYTKSDNPEPIVPKIVLAGGLSPDNAVQAIEQTGIHTLDVCSGIESAPGVKDHEKLRRMMKIKTSYTL